MENIGKFVNFNPKVICEVGIFRSDCIHSLPLRTDETKMILVEPNPTCFQEVYNALKNYPNMEFHQKAVADTKGFIKLYNRPDKHGQDASGFIEGLSSCPAIVNDGYVIDEKDAIIVESILFSEIDKGDIEVLCVDTEGSEWFVLKNMISRPKIISLETHGRNYRNPFLKEIIGWMLENKYKVVGQDSCDTVFEKI